MGLSVAVDFGSTYTKAVAVDLERGQLLGVAQSPSTVTTDMTVGLHRALAQLRVGLDLGNLSPERIVASSSAAGGLNVVAAGLVKGLTAKAAEEAALGAGAKLKRTYAHGLSVEDLREIERDAPDIILLAGGTDGGDRACIVHNAALLAGSRLAVPFIVAGNKLAAGQARSLLEAGGKDAIVVENVLPELDRLNVEPARSAIRETFMQRIIHAKGLDRAQEILGIIMPTPTAVLLGARLLAEGTEDEPGIGELVVVDVGGATTDVDSVAQGHPSGEAVLRGLPEPYLKRTVEGDLGIRYNAETIVRNAGRKKLLDTLAAIDDSAAVQVDVEGRAQALARRVDAVPRSELDHSVDTALASVAVETAVARHCGRLEELYFPTGKVRVQHGKDLTGVRSVVGTGGIFAYGRDQGRILKSACFHVSSPESLRPRAPEFLVDERYVLYAVGLLSETAPSAALRIMKRHLRRLP